ncbi:hypothetical protein Rsub_07217 [Raphidocelis subcapitata]|uniref:Uncharacterized protein n=1 Tax=Raphidocelis subcapitata TaxID=307507 RepID=A0A2V0P937_9CHLO|nr:hypothetical protein Rsub_07217 [Raphidocelis subcapitata]|eukprot:GBF94403.1 hypothetical protein Rsub_07217 [Raphidocelis subcapitata]
MAARSETVLGNLKQLLNVTFGVRGTRNAASWIAAGGLAYYLIYVPEQQRRQEIERERLLAKERAVAAGLVEIDRARPIPDPQDRGLIKGAGAGSGGGAAAKS